MIMKAEEYINGNKFQNQYGGYDISDDYAFEAIEMARKEVREKAIEVARTIIHPMSENGEQENRIMANFKKLLNK